MSSVYCPKGKLGQVWVASAAIDSGSTLPDENAHGEQTTVDTDVLTVGAVIYRARKRLNFTQRGLAKKIGVSRQSIAAWESDVSRPKSEHAALLAEVLGVPLSTISADPTQLNVEYLDGTVQSTGRVPLLSWIEAGRGAEVVSAYAFDSSQEFVEPTGAVSKEGFALRVVGRSMEPEFPEGTTIIIDPAVAPLPNDFVVAELLPAGAQPGNGNAMLKQYRPRGPSAFDLIPLNPDFQTVTVNKDNPGRVIGTVVESIRKHRHR